MSGGADVPGWKTDRLESEINGSFLNIDINMEPNRMTKDDGAKAHNSLVSDSLCESYTCERGMTLVRKAVLLGH